jgi:glycosyltransferase involved in cell wall biosynthesis
LDVTLVIPNYNRADALLQTLDALTRLDYPGDAWEAVVVDDGSPEDVRGPVEAWIARTGAPVRFFSQQNAGPAAARNRGAAAARGAVLIFIDNDVLVEPDFLRQHLDALATHPRAWIVGRVIQPEQLHATPFGRYRDQLHERFHHSHPAGDLTETIWITTQNLSLPTRDFRELGGFDESFTIASSEDWELGYRARQRGIRMLYHGGLAVRHNDWAIDLERFCERQRTYSLSDVLLWRKYGSDTPRSVLIRENAAISWTQDPPRRIVRKLAKAFLSARLNRAAVLGICRGLERFCPDTPLCHRAYELAIGAAIYRGVQEGLRKYPSPAARVLAAPGAPAAGADSPGARPRVSVVMPTHNRKEALLPTLDALAAVDYPAGQWEVVLVDDGSTDGTEAAVRAWLQAHDVPLRYLRQEQGGPASARNRGAAAATGEVLVFLDDDITVAPSFLHDHVTALAAHPGSWIAGRITHSEALRKTPFGEYRYQVWERFHQQHAGDRITETEGGSAANLSLPAADFRRLHGFDESFSSPSSEDWDLGLRARASGVRVLYHPQLTTVHNDWAVDLPRFCERQRTYSVADVLLWRKYGDGSPRLTVIHRNGPVRWSDGPSLIWKKGAKRLLATQPGQSLLLAWCRGIERAAPGSRLSHWSYDIAVAVAIYRGVREGMDRYPVEPASGGRPASGVRDDRPEGSRV